jgi:hypothetical protein
MAGLPESGDGAVDARAGVRGRDAEHPGDLGVAEAGVELQGDELAVARLQAVERGADGGAAERVLVVGPGRRGLDVLGVRQQRRVAAAPAQLVERRVAGQARWVPRRGSKDRWRR